jgi:hypothetical protein
MGILENSKRPSQTGGGIWNPYCAKQIKICLPDTCLILADDCFSNLLGSLWADKVGAIPCSCPSSRFLYAFLGKDLGLPIISFVPVSGKYKGLLIHGKL